MQKRFHIGFIYLIVVATFVLALSAPASLSAASTRATLLESIQQQINELVAAVTRIQARIMELLTEAAKPPAAVPEIIPEKEAAGSLGGTATETDTVVTAPVEVWKFMPLPSTYLTQPLALLYRFSITAGTADVVIPSATFTITLASVSVKDLGVYAFSDELLSVPAFLRDVNKNQNRVGKRIGYLDSENKINTILFDQGPPQVKIPAGMTYYFELRGTVVGKNSGAFAIISAEKLPEVKLE